MGVLLVIIILLLGSYLINHHSNAYIIRQAKKDIQNNQSSLLQAVLFCKNLVKNQHEKVVIDYRYGWPKMHIELISNNKKVKNEYYEEDVPVFITPLMWGSNSIHIIFSKGDFMSLEYPYSNYMLCRSKLIYTDDQRSFLQQYNAKKNLEENKKVNNNIMPYKINSNWLLLIK